MADLSLFPVDQPSSFHTRGPYLKLNHLLKAICVSAVLFSCGSLVNVAAQTTPARRDWVRYPAVVDEPAKNGFIFPDIIAIGDVHGDPEALLGVLRGIELIDRATPTDVKPGELIWHGGQTRLVMTGDLIDKGPNSLRVIALVIALQKAAAKASGEVIILMGNHEAVFLSDPNDSKAEDFRSELIAAKLDPQKVASCDGDLGQFLCNLPVAAKLNDWFFSHAGNTDGKTVAELSAIIQTAFADRRSLGVFSNDGNSIVDARLNKKGCAKMAWFYDCGRQTDPEVILKRNAAALGVKHIVEGHSRTA
jgi:hypothetical protein